MTALEVLQRSPLFKDFSEAGLRTFAELARARALPAGAPLFVEGAPGESLFIVVAGTVRITRRAGGVERELAVLGAGEHLGELGLLARSVRLVSATAATACEVLELAQRDFFKKALEKPAACLKLSLAIASDLAARMSDGRDALLEPAARAHAPADPNAQRRA